MYAQLLDGRALAAAAQAALLPHVADVMARRGRPPGLGVILVGDHGPSEIYVSNKMRAAKAMGLYAKVCKLAASATQKDVAAAIATFNADAAIDAFLLQLPLPPHLDAQALLEGIDPRKDGDGLHPRNVMALQQGSAAPRPCTPKACMALVAHTGVPIEGAHAVVVGRSVVVGRPLAQMLLQADATVTVCHGKTQDLGAHVARADLLFVAVGRAAMVRGEWIKPGAVVVDVGINRTVVANGKAKLCGDVDFAGASQRASYITPVPGGVGPMTIAMLLHNTVQAARSDDAPHPAAP